MRPQNLSQMQLLEEGIAAISDDLIEQTFNPESKIKRCETFDGRFVNDWLRFIDRVRIKLEFEKLFWKCVLKKNHGH